MESIYGSYAEDLPRVLSMVCDQMERFNEAERARTGTGLYEHLSARVKSDESMRDKCRRRGLPESVTSALGEVHDAMGIRIVCRFVDDVYTVARCLHALAGDPSDPSHASPDATPLSAAPFTATVVSEKDYIARAKPNGYRSYHVILSVTPVRDANYDGHEGPFFLEFQIRTIAQDTWAALEHELKYKHEVTNERLITSELKRCADELASCDVSMQTIRNLINDTE